MYKYNRVRWTKQQMEEMEFFFYVPGENILNIVSVIFALM